MRASRSMSWCNGWWRTPRPAAEAVGAISDKTVRAPVDEPDCARANADQDPANPGFDLFIGHPRIRRFAARLAQIPQGAGVAASLLLLAATLSYGAVVGGHGAAITDWFKNARDNAANAFGFRIAAVSVSGGSQINREQALALAGVTDRSSLLFFDAESARARLVANPWIADAAVLKLYPDRLLITITERRAFALWQRNGAVNVVADDGTVLQPFVGDRYG